MKINGVLGCGLLPLLWVLELWRVGEGSLLRLSNEYTLMGIIAPVLAGAFNLPLEVAGTASIDSFFNRSLHYPQVQQLRLSKPLAIKKTKPSASSEKKNVPRLPTKKRASRQIIKLTGSQRKLVNFAINATSLYTSPFEDIFPESDVVQGLETFISLESIGITPETSSYDERPLREFDDSVEFQEGRYHVDLPWHTEMKNIALNFGLAEVIARKVSAKIEDMGISEQ